MRRRNLIGLALAGGTGLLASAAIGGTIVHTLAGDFTAVEDVGASSNVSVVADNLELTSIDALHGTDFYRGAASFGQSAWWIELQKDSGTSLYTAAHPCVEYTDLSAFFSDAYHYDAFTSTFRAGDELVVTAAASLPSGTDVLTADWESDANFRANELAFLTSGTHHAGGAPTPANYTVTLDYATATDDVLTINIPPDSLPVGAPGAVLTDDTLDGLCTAADRWCVFETGDAIGGAAITCDADYDDIGHLWEVRVFLDPAEQINGITIDYPDYPTFADGLGGPLAATLFVDESTYSAHASAFGMFNYQGNFTTLTNVIDAGAPALWFQADYSQTLNGGQIQVEVDCDETNGGYQAVNWNNGGTWPFSDSIAAPGFPIVSAIDQDDDTPGAPADDNPGDHCRGQYASYTVYMLSTEDLANPTLDDITLTYAVDADEDGWGVGLDLPPHQSGQEDECDNDPTITGAAPTWYPDCDGDGFFDADNPCASQCAAPTAGTCDICAGAQPAGGWTSTLPVANDDCDDTLGGDPQLDGRDAFPGKTLGSGDLEDVGDGQDNDCDGNEECFLDADDDGYGTADGVVNAAAVTCDDTALDGINESTVSTDCAGANAAINPGATPVVNDGFDNDCSLNNGGTGDECYDDSGDGDGDGSASMIDSADGDCLDADESTTNTDCAPTDPAIQGANPTVVVDDGKDNDCSTGGTGDECYEDVDGDGFGTLNLVDSVNASCADAGESTTNDDCDDTLGGDPQTDGRDAYPGKTLDSADLEDVLDGQDNDCDGNEECFLDGDDDGVGGTGTPVNESITDGDAICTDVAADTFLESSTSTDCDDTDATGTANADWYPDCDGDGVHASVAVNACGTSGADAATPCGDGQPPDGGWDTVAGTDCDDEDAVAADPNHGWHADCDGDGATQTTGDILACTASDALLDTTECAGNTNGDNPFVVTFAAGTDCDDTDPVAQGAEAWYHDCDNDGVFSTDSVNVCGAGGANAAYDCLDGFDPDGGWTTTPGTDCNDENGTYSDPNQTWYPDCDGDAALFGTDVITACTDTDALADTVACAGNANSDNPYAVSTTAPGTPDCDDTDATGQVAEDWYPDCDNDGTFDSSPTNACGTTGADAAFDCVDAADPDGGWTTTAGTDCNDEDGAADTVTNWWPDCDSDGIYDTTPVSACGTLGADLAFDCGDGADPDGGWSGTAGTDCDDEDALYADPNQTWYADCDGDAVLQGTADITSCSMTTALADTTECTGNGNSDNPFNVSTSAPVTPDCDDNDALYADPTQTWYADCDGDSITQGTADITSCSMTTALADTTECAGNGNSDNPFNVSTTGPATQDCDDFNADAWPGNTIVDGYVNDGADNDCQNGEECFVDFDDDGYGEAGAYINESGGDGCTNTAGDGIGESSFGTDCHPNNADAYPNKTLVDADVADPDDNDCSGGVGNLEQECFRDDDDDGFGEPGSYITENQADGDDACVNTIGDGILESTLATDCHDDNPDAFPSNILVDAHVADPDDNDCSGGIGNLEQECFADNDDDGWGVSGTYVVEDQTDGDDACSNATADAVLESSQVEDCDDSLANVNPGTADVCGDGLDNDCDGNGNFATPGPGGYLDDDGDGVTWADEQIAGTDDCAGDTDGDGLTDAEELNDVGTNPLVYDTDGDGLGDGFEVGGDPLNPINTDEFLPNGDGLIDALDPDDDGDNVPTIDEGADEITPLNTDAALFNGDGIPDYLDNDDDGDSVLTADEAYGGNTDPQAENTDSATGDTTPDYLDDDDDGDGILTYEEVNFDALGEIDADGIPGYLDDDSDGDGWTDAYEYATGLAAGSDDTDGDGNRDHVDFDSDDDTVLDIDELDADTDGTGGENRIDDDDDGDTLLTADESYTGYPPTVNTDLGLPNGDAIPDYLDDDDDGDQILTAEEFYAPNTDIRLQQSDGDGVPDYLDFDDDGDSVSTFDEDINGSGDPRDDDTDGDGIDNYLDDDDDNDGILTINEDPDGDGDPTSDNTDGDFPRIPNYLDTDDDNDGILTSIEIAAIADPDGDTVPNHLDLDSDEDGWSDEYEYANGQGGARDSDGDGDADYVDTDSDDDTVLDIDEIGNELLAINLQDDDGNGVPNRLDPDDDGDNVPTAIEVYFPETNVLLQDSDGDGISDFRDDDDDNDNVLTIDEDPDVPGDPTQSNTDFGYINGDALPNYLDSDDDGDSIPTKEEVYGGNNDPLAENTDASLSVPDAIPDFLDQDDDNDGIDTLLEDVDGNGDPRNDNTETALSYANSDGIPDYLDEDDDNDGVLTMDEDVDNDGIWTNDDTDNNGIPDYRDNDDDGDTVLTENEALTGDALTTNTDAPGPQFPNGDLIPDFRDDDDDGDGLLTALEDVVTVDGNPMNDNTDAALPNGDGLPNYLDPDDDGDNVLTIDEDADNSGDVRDDNTDSPGADFPNGDNIPDYLDNDDDGDGLLTQDEVYGGNTDPLLENTDATYANSDLIPDFRDPDDDGDSLLTVLEDSDGSGTITDDNTDAGSLYNPDALPDWRDEDDDGDGILTALEDRDGSGDVRDDDSDGDTIPDYLDDDDDNDGVATPLEDLNGDGDWSNDHTDGLLVDGGDGIPDYLDNDDDNDGVLTINEDVNGDGDWSNDNTDALVDGIPNYRDNDDDGDNVLTINEAYAPNTDPMLENTDALLPGGDAIPDYLDDDDDGDTVPTALEDVVAVDGDPRNDNTDGTYTRNPDAIPNYLDPDDDNDGVFTIDEDPNGDGDPTNDNTDAATGDTDPDYLDIDDDGDSVETLDEAPTTGDPLTENTDDPAGDPIAFANGDAIPNFLDDDDDGDGVLTIDEAPTTGDPLTENTDFGLTDAGGTVVGDALPNFLDPDDDGDHVLTFHEAYGANTDPLLENTDAATGDLIPDFLDVDDDGDSVNTVDEDPDGDGLPETDDTDTDGTANYLDDDDDGDNVLTIDEDPNGNGDPLDDNTDLATGDVTPNFLDNDDDGDTIPTIDEVYGANTDPMLENTDASAVIGADAIPDYLDPDDDGDSLLTILEDSDGSGVITDDNTDGFSPTGDQLPDYLDDDDDGDSLLTALEDVDGDGDVRNDDGDGDGTPNYLDDDDDNDGVGTIDEDTDGDGDWTNDDADGNGTPNYLDDDDDGDSIPTSAEAYDGNTDPLLQNTDASTGDTLPDFLDADDDGDNVLTIDEAYGANTDPRLENTDAAYAPTGDNLPDYRDPDDDGDNVLTVDEAYGANSDPMAEDTDSDGTPDYLDTDDDDDSVDTRDEAHNGNTDPMAENTDEFSPNAPDAVPDYLDTDDDGDSVATIDESPDLDGNPLNDDTDSDGTPNFLDDDDDGDNVPTYDEDSVNVDGDPLNDNTDELATYGDLDPDFLDNDDDGDLVPTADEAYAPNTDPQLEDTDGDLIPDYLDTDDDADAVLTENEAYLPNTDPQLEDTDANGTPDYLDVDDDGDTVDTVNEAYAPNTDPMSEDTDGDSTPDYLDTDDDGDGVPTAAEDVVTVDGDPRNDNTDLNEPAGDDLPNYLDNDDDGDSILTADEDLNGDGDPTQVPQDDFDFDGTPDYLDPDDDDDTVPTYYELRHLVSHHAFDHDGDGIDDGREWLNWLRTDIIVDCVLADCDDLDGGTTGDGLDNPWDRDGDGTINARDGDDDGDNIQTLLEPSTDNECLGGFDGIPTYLDFDADGDGITDLDEGENDDDGDFIPNFLDCDASGCSGDTDNDGIPNCRDVQLAGGDTSAALNPDYDGDGIIDGDEVGSDPNCLNPDTTVVCQAQDTDGDGDIDIIDPDDDGDGFLTIDELDPDCAGVITLDPVTFEILCDGVEVDPANTDEDTGGPWPRNPDDVPNYLDDDDDGDGTPSDVEGDGDVDGDGIVNYLDPNDVDGPLADADQDGISNGDEEIYGSDPYNEDSDGDSIPDDEEGGGDPTADSDNDGIPDILDDDDDGDGIPTAEEGVSDIDGDGIPNYLDTDRDGDSLDDDVESQTEDEDCDGVVDIDDGNPDDGPCSVLDDTGLQQRSEIKNDGCDGCAGTGSSPAGGAALFLGLAGLLLRRRRE